MPFPTIAELKERQREREKRERAARAAAATAPPRRSEAFLVKARQEAAQPTGIVNLPFLGPVKGLTWAEIQDALAETGRAVIEKPGQVTRAVIGAVTARAPEAPAAPSLTPLPGEAAMMPEGAMLGPTPPPVPPETGRAWKQALKVVPSGLLGGTAATAASAIRGLAGYPGLGILPPPIQQEIGRRLGLPPPLGIGTAEKLERIAEEREKAVPPGRLPAIAYGVSSFLPAAVPMARGPAVLARLGAIAGLARAAQAPRLAGLMARPLVQRGLRMVPEMAREATTFGGAEFMLERGDYLETAAQRGAALAHGAILGGMARPLGKAVTRVPGLARMRQPSFAAGEHAVGLGASAGALTYAQTGDAPLALEQAATFAGISGAMSGIGWTLRELQVPTAGARYEAMAKQIMGALEPEPRTAAQIAESTGLGERSVRAVLLSQGLRGEVESLSEGYYQRPGARPAVEPEAPPARPVAPVGEAAPAPPAVAPRAPAVSAEVLVAEARGRAVAERGARVEAPPAEEVPARVGEPVTPLRAQVGVEPWPRQVEAAAERLRRKWDTVRPIAPELTLPDIADAVTVGRGLVDMGARTFAAWRPRMLEKIGPGMWPHLERVWREVREAQRMEGVPTLTLPDQSTLAEVAGGVDPYGVITPRRVGADPIRAADIVAGIQRTLLPVRTGRLGRVAHVLGIYKVRPEVIRSRFANALPEIAHEMGHHLHKLLFPKLTPKGALSAKAIPREYWEPLRALVPKGTRGAVVEGYGEFVRLYLTDPPAAKARLPNLYNLLERRLGEMPEVRKSIDQLRTDIARWIDQPALAKVLATQVTSREAVERRKPARPLVTGLRKPIVNWFDQEVALEALKHDVGLLVRASIDPITQQRLISTTSTGRARQWVEHGIYEMRKGQLVKVAESMNTILETARKAGFGDETFTHFNAYLGARHALHMAERGLPVPPGLEPSIAREALRALDKPAFREAAKMVRQYNRELRRLLEEEMQVVEPGWGKRMEEKWPNYVPMIPVVAERGAVTATAPTRWPQAMFGLVKRLRGGGEERIMPLEEMARRTYVYHAIAEQAKAVRFLADWADKTSGVGWIAERVPPKMQRTLLGEQGMELIRRTLREKGELDDVDAKALSELFSDTALWRSLLRGSAGENVMPVFRKGKVDLYQLHPDLTAMLLRPDRNLLSHVGWMGALLRGARTLVRDTNTVLSPLFVFVRNPVRDIPTGDIQSGDYLFAWRNWVSAAVNLYKGDMDAQTFIYSGGAQIAARGARMETEARVTVPRDLQTFMRDAPTMLGKARAGLRKAGRFYLKPAEVTENATRMAIWKSRLQYEMKRGTPYEDAIRIAALEARAATVPFERGGTYSRALNEFIPFFNAAMQGIGAAERAYRARPVETTVKGMMYVGLPTMLLYAHNYDNPDWQNLPPWRKYAGYAIPIGKDERGETKFIHLPGPWEWQLLFGVPALAVAEWIRTNDPPLWKDMVEISGDLVSPVELDNPLHGMAGAFIGPWLGLAMNRDWAGRPIVPAWQEDNVPPRLQAGPATSNFARSAGRITGFSPRHIDYILYSYTGTAGRTVVGTADSLLERIGIGEREAGELGWARGLIYKASWYDGAASKFYEENERLAIWQQEVDAGLRKPDLARSNRLDQGQRLRSRLSELNRMSRKITANDALTPEQRRARLDEIQILKMRLVTEFMGVNTPDWAQRTEKETGTPAARLGQRRP